jgi:hypothetical protein
MAEVELKDIPIRDGQVEAHTCILTTSYNMTEKYNPEPTIHFERSSEHNVRTREAV